MTKWKDFIAIMGGDINSSFDITCDKPSVKKLQNILRQHNFHYVKTKPTKLKACIENAFINFPYDTHTSDVKEFILSYHSMLTVEFKKIKTNKQQQVPAEIIQVKQHHYTN